MAAGCLAGARAVQAADVEILDRVVASVDYHAITESDVNKEYRVERFLDGEMPQSPPDAQARNRIRQRLVERMLLFQEVEKGLASNATGKAASSEWEEIQKKFDSAEAFQTAFEALGLSREQVLRRLHVRDAILHLIDQRLRPEAFPEPSDVETYYKKTFVPAYLKRNQGPAPPFSDVEGRIREILTQQKINKLLDAWLNDLKTSHRVELHDF